MDCWNRLMEGNERPEAFLLSRDLDLCEMCGEFKPVIVRMRYRYSVIDWGCKRISYPEKHEE